MRPVTRTSTNSSPAPWRVSLHGGHCGAYCDHAVDTLEAVAEAAVAAGYHTFGLSEHAPRVRPEHLYPEETAMGWNVGTLAKLFEEYAAEADRLIPAFADRITLLKGFETEVVPHDSYAEVMLGWRKQYGFDYIVGSVHWIGDVIIDYSEATFQQALRGAGGLEALCIAYYEKVIEMVGVLDPEVIGHLDLPRKYVGTDAEIETPAIRAAAERALDAIAEQGGILDLNTAGYRKGLGHPYPGPWLVGAARERGIPFCFGDDSHGVRDVGAGIDDARRYLLAQGIGTVTVLTRGATGNIVRRVEALGADPQD